MADEDGGGGSKVEVASGGVVVAAGRGEMGGACAKEAVTVAVEVVKGKMSETCTRTVPATSTRSGILPHSKEPFA